MKFILLSGMLCNERLWQQLFHCSPVLAQHCHYVDLTQNKTLKGMLSTIDQAVRSKN